MSDLESIINKAFENREKINFSNLDTILKDLKSIFNKKGYAINWSELEKQDLYNTINTCLLYTSDAADE